ncbi:amidase signature enzyme [Lophium mytilinum]|uniref:Amidase signature enzyme n=1 Tax=Lophium mytilinum TaxID=390894 RepID=A0A6A6QN50_9PEZI|nr:amidase signature enzyme [Lophium mytilinum]
MAPRTTLTIGGSDFLVHEEPTFSIHPSEDHAPLFTPLTLFSWDKPLSSGKDLRENTYRDIIKAKFASFDDVWNEGFSDIEIIRGASSSIGYRSNPGQQKKSSSPWIEQRLEYTSIKDHGPRTHEKIPDGPYVANPQGDVFAVSRLFEDSQQCFIGGSLSRKFHVDRPHQAYGWLQTDRIAVPSRLYSEERSGIKPLAGLRFAVKDLIDVKGLETGGGSLAYRSVQDPAHASAPFINQLIADGAVLVGKMRCTQFGDGQDPLERFEEITPFNPRGDGFQKPSSSSSGSAAACAAYEWLDFTIGTDTGGSIRHPAGVNGLYGMRPSLGSVDSSGIIVTPLMDTAGVFARTAQALQAVTKSMAHSKFPLMRTPSHKQLNKWKIKLLYPVRSSKASPSDAPRLFPNPDQVTEQPEADAIFESTISTLESAFSVTRQTFSLDAFWASTHPADLPADLVEATGLIYQHIVYPSIHTNIVQPLREAYAAKNSGRAPFIEPILAARLEYGAKVTSAETAAAEKALKSFGDWVNNFLLAPSEDEDPDTIPILVFPQAWGTPAYRDQVNPRTDTLFWTGFSLYGISYCSGCVDVTVPVGEIGFHSKISQTKEKLPVALSVLAKKGMDGVVTELLKILEQEGALKGVEVGRTLYGDGVEEVEANPQNDGKNKRPTEAVEESKSGTSKRTKHE